MKTEELLGNNLIELDEKLTAFKDHHHKRGLEEARELISAMYVKQNKKERDSDGRPETEANHKGYLEGLEHAFIILGRKLGVND